MTYTAVWYKSQTAVIIKPRYNRCQRFITKRYAGYQSAWPKAYLNIVELDEQLNPVITKDGKNSTFEQMPVESE